MASDDYDRGQQRAAGMKQQIDILSRLQGEVSYFRSDYIRYSELMLGVLHRIDLSDTATVDAIQEQTENELSFEEQRKKDLERSEQQERQREKARDERLEHFRATTEKISRTVNAISNLANEFGISLKNFESHSKNLNEYLKESGVTRETAKALGDKVETVTKSLNASGSSLYNTEEYIEKMYSLAAEGFIDLAFLADEDNMKNLIEADATTGIGLRNLASLFDSFSRRYNMSAEESKELLDNIVANTAESKTTAVETTRYLQSQRDVLEDVIFRSEMEGDGVSAEVLMENFSKMYTILESMDYSDEQVQEILNLFTGSMRGEYSAAAALAGLDMYDTGTNLARQIANDPYTVISKFVNAMAAQYTLSDYNATKAGYFGVSPGVLTHSAAYTGRQGALTSEQVAVIAASLGVHPEDADDRADQQHLSILETIKNDLSYLTNWFYNNTPFGEGIAEWSPVLKPIMSTASDIAKTWGIAKLFEKTLLKGGSAAAGGAAGTGAAAGGAAASGAAEAGSAETAAGGSLLGTIGLSAGIIAAASTPFAALGAGINYLASAEQKRGNLRRESDAMALAGMYSIGARDAMQSLVDEMQQTGTWNYDTFSALDEQIGTDAAIDFLNRIQGYHIIGSSDRFVLPDEWFVQGQNRVAAMSSVSRVDTSKILSSLSSKESDKSFSEFREEFTDLCTFLYKWKEENYSREDTNRLISNLKEGSKAVETQNTSTGSFFGQLLDITK